METKKESKKENKKGFWASLFSPKPCHVRVAAT